MTKGYLKYRNVFNLAEAGARYFRQAKKLIQALVCLYVLLSFVLDLLGTYTYKITCLSLLPDQEVMELRVLLSCPRV